MIEESKQRKIGAVLSYFSIIVTTLVQLLYTPYLIKTLGQSEYGLYSLVSSIIGYLTVLDLGFGNAIIVYTSKYRAQGKYEEEKKLHGMFFIVFCVIGIIASIFGILLYFNVDTFFSSTMTSAELNKAKIMMLILTFNLAITFPFSIYSSIISAYEKFTFQKIIAIANTLVKPLLMIPLLAIGYKSITMTVVLTLANIMSLVSNYIYCRKKLCIKIKFLGFDKILFKTILGYSIWIFLGVIVDKINWSIDQFVLGAVSGTIAVSIYSVANQINTLFVNLSNSISGVMLPKISKMIAKKATPEELTEEMIKVGRIQVYIIFLMVSGLIIFGKKFIILWVGKTYISSYYCLLFLSVPLAIPLIQNLGISIRQALNKHKVASLINIFVAIVNFIFTLFLAKRYGAIGASVGTGMGTIITIILINIFYHKSLKLNMLKFWKNIINLVTPFLILSILSYFLVNSLIISDSLIIYCGEIIIYTIIYATVSYFLCFNQYEKGIINMIIGKVLKKGGKVC